MNRVTSGRFLWRKCECCRRQKFIGNGLCTLTFSKRKWGCYEVYIAVIIDQGVDQSVGGFSLQASQPVSRLKLPHSSRLRCIIQGISHCSCKLYHTFLGTKNWVEWVYINRKSFVGEALYNINATYGMICLSPSAYLPQSIHTVLSF